MTALTDTNWRLRGNCVTRPIDPDVMYPDHSPSDEAKAKRKCNGCPVSAECFLDAIANRDWEGVRAEMTGKERKEWFDNHHPEGRYRKHRNCVDCGTQYTPRQDAQIRCRTCSRTYKKAAR